MNSRLDRFVTIRSIVAQGRPGHDAADLILVKGGAKRRRASPPLDLCCPNVRGRDTSAPDFIRSIQAVYLKRDGAVSVCRVANQLAAPAVTGTSSARAKIPGSAHARKVLLNIHLIFIKSLLLSVESFRVFLRVLLLVLVDHNRAAADYGIQHPLRE